MGGRQNYDLSLGTLKIRCRILMGIQKGTIILTTSHIHYTYEGLGFRVKGYGSLPRLRVLSWVSYHKDYSRGGLYWDPVI